MGTQIDRIDGLSSSTAIKGPCRVATTANITLSDLQTIDGVELADGDRVLVRAQTDARLNGIYRVSTGLWQRTKDFSSNRDVRKGTRIVVTDGITYATSEWIVTAANPVVFGTSEVTFSQIFFSTGSDVTITGVGVIVKETLSDLNAVTPTDENFGGRVLDDPDPTNNGDYYRQASAWVKGADLQRYNLSRLTITGGTVNAIEATTDDGVNPYSAVGFFIDIPDGSENTGAVTIAINGDAPISAVDWDGTAFDAGYFRGRMLLSNETTSLKNLDPAAISAREAEASATAAATSETNAAASETAAAASESAAATSETNAAASEAAAAASETNAAASEAAAATSETNAAASASAAASSETNAGTSETNAAASAASAASSASSASTDADRAETAATSVVAMASFKTVAELLADNNSVVGYTGSGADFIVAEGDIMTAQGFRYEVQASGASTFLATAGGVKLECVSQVVSIEAYGTDKDSWDEDAVRAALRTKRVLAIEGGYNSVTIYCDPVSGNDASAGSEVEPVATFQEASDRFSNTVYDDCLPIIDLATAAALPVTYDEDVHISLVRTNNTGSDSQGSWGKMLVIGDMTTPENVEVGSIVVSGCYGTKAPDLRGLTMLRHAPAPGDVNEEAAIQFFSSAEVGARFIKFAPGVKRGIMCYAAEGDFREIWADNITGTIIYAKRKAHITVQQINGTFNPDASPTAFDGYPFGATEGARVWYLGAPVTLGPNAQGQGGRTRYGSRVTYTYAGEGRARVWTDEWKNYGVTRSATLSSDQVVSSGSFVRLGWNDVISDSRGEFDTATGRVVLRPGIYSISCRIAILTSTISSGQGLQLRLQDGDNTEIALFDTPFNGGAGLTRFTASLHEQVDLTEASGNGLVLETRLQYVGGTSCTVEAGARNSKFTITRIG